LHRQWLWYWPEQELFIAVSEKNKIEELYILKNPDAYRHSGFLYNNISI
jgi:hypothetical protein